MFGSWFIQSSLVPKLSFFFSFLQDRMLEYAKTKLLMQGILRQFENDDAVVENSLRIEVGTPNISFITRLVLLVVNVSLYS